MKPELDHPCRQTCSGWQQGYDKGYDAGILWFAEQLRSYSTGMSVLSEEKIEAILIELELSAEIE